MEELAKESGNVRLYRDESGKWLIYRLDVGENAKMSDLEAVFGSIAENAGKTDKAVCIALENVERPNSRMLAALVSLVTKANGESREVALAAPDQSWTDMLDVLGIRGNFTVIESLGALGAG
ncbi:MAG: STAS domain-containing protein [Planctomycetes bacterium]|nr:STAS domain-containing protein [Planctomycetota bacterium]